MLRWCNSFFWFLYLLRSLIEERIYIFHVNAIKFNPDYGSDQIS